MTRFAPANHVVAREVGGEQVLLDMRSGAYFGLNEVGTAIWQALEDNVSDIAALTERVVERFAVEPPAAEADIRELLSELQTRELVTQAD